MIPRSMITAMAILVSISLCLITASSSAEPPDPDEVANRKRVDQDDYEKILGTWKATTAEENGKEFQYGPEYYRFRKDGVDIWGTVPGIPVSVYEGFRVDTSHNLKRLDIIEKYNGWTIYMAGAYELDGDTLVYVHSDGSFAETDKKEKTHVTPRPDSLHTKPGDKLTRVIFKRVTDATEAEPPSER